MEQAMGRASKRKPNKSRSEPDFSAYANLYAQSRPTYPHELYAWLASVVDAHHLAWDTATGNGQAAIGLAKFFERVVATDISSEQLAHAPNHPRVEYRAARAEASGLDDGCVDLVVAAAAMHWFDLPRFYEEARRVIRPGGVLAAWTYHVAHLEGPPAEVIGRFYEHRVKDYFGSGARLVDARYQTIELPGESLPAPQFHVSARWTREQMLAFVRSWSGVQTYTQETGEDATHDLVNELARAWGTADTIDVRWPIYIVAARLS
jgi:SAM-dependent methyltransferase